MIISPDGKFVVGQRNQTSVLLDADKRTARELTDQVDRFVFAKAGGRGIAVLKDPGRVYFRFVQVTSMPQAASPARPHA